jgi:predicted RNase H-like nuclease (RuvC/YqgF family)
MESIKFVLDRGAVFNQILNGESIQNLIHQVCENAKSEGQEVKITNTGRARHGCRIYDKLKNETKYGSLTETLGRLVV